MTILFIGLGNMGAPMARNLAKRFDVLLSDVNVDVADALAAELGSQTVDLARIPTSVDTVVLMVPSSRVVESLVLGPGRLLEQLAADSMIIDMSSAEPSSTQRLAALASQRGIAYVDAPVSGGVAKAETAELAIMVGAETSAFERARKVLGALGGSIHHVGAPGAGDVAKALNNLLSATNIAAAAETLSAAARFGIEPEAMLEVINASTGRSQASEVKFPSHVLTGTFSSGFGMDLMLKDLAIARSLTVGAGLIAPVTDAAHTSALQARELTGPSPDHTEIVRVYEHTNATPLRVRSQHEQRKPQ